MSDSEFKSVREDINKLTESEFIVKYGLIDKATQVLLKLVEVSNKEPERFLTLAEVRRNFKRITTDEVYAITGELEKLKLVETSVKKTRLIVRFNVFGLQTNGFDQVRQERLKNYIHEKENKRLEHARKVLKEFEDRQSLKVVQQQQRFNNVDTTKTPFELHDSKECDPTICRFCAIEQDKTIGF